MRVQISGAAQMVQSLVEAEQLCEQAVDRWFERRGGTTIDAAAFDEVLERSVTSRFALRVVRERFKTAVFPAPANMIASLTAFAIANTLKY